MKLILCSLAVTFAAAVSYGWGLGDALKTVDKVTQTVKAVDSTVNGKTTDSSDAGAKSVASVPGAPASAANTPAYDARMRRKIQDECES